MFVDNMITNAVNNIHTAYLARVVRVNGNRATVQPLSRYQETGQQAAEQAVVSAFILNQAQHYLSTLTITPVTNVTPTFQTQTIDGVTFTYVKSVTPTTQSYTVVSSRPIQAGDTVLCVACERDISGQTFGQITTPDPSKNYSLSNSVIVGIV